MMNNCHRMYSNIIDNRHYITLNDESDSDKKYFLYECMYRAGDFIYMEIASKNKKNFTDSTVININRFIPKIFHKKILKYYYNEKQKELK
jgi:hypothetical protein